MDQEIQQCEERLLQAFREKDTVTLDKLIDDNLIFNGPDGTVINKEMDMATYRAADTLIEKMDCLDRQVQAFGDTAIVSTVVYLKATFMSGKYNVDGKARFFRTWKRTDGQWKIIGGASVVIA